MQWGRGSVLLHPCFGVTVGGGTRTAQSLWGEIPQKWICHPTNPALGAGQEDCRNLLILHPDLSLSTRDAWQLKSENVCCSAVSDSLQSHGLWPTRLPCPRDSSLGKNTRVDSRSLLQGIFLTQGLNLGLLHCWQIPYHLRMESQVCEINVWA